MRIALFYVCLAENKLNLARPSEQPDWMDNTHQLRMVERSRLPPANYTQFQADYTKPIPG